MLTIRRSQLDALSASPRAVFEDELTAHLREFFPLDCALAGERQTRRAAALAVDRGTAHGFSLRGTLARYAGLMVGLGSYFDDDPQLPWVTDILGPRDVPETARMGRLDERAVAHMERVAGTSGRRHLAAMLRCRAMPFDELTRRPLDAADGVGILHRLYPEKAADVTAAGLEPFLREARDGARRHRVDDPRGVVLYAVLMMMLGTHFARDPWQPWAVQALADAPDAEPVSRARLLHAASMDAIDRTLAGLTARGT